MTRKELHKKVLEKNPKLLVNPCHYSELLDIFTEIFNENNNVYIQQQYFKVKDFLPNKKNKNK